MKKSEKICYLLAALCLLLGALLQFVYTAARFTGFLFWCAAGVLAVWGLLSRRDRPWTRWGKRVLLALLAAGFAFFAVLEAWVISWARTDREPPVAAVVVLGAGIVGDQPSLSLLTRLEAALDYVADKPDVPIIVTGSQGPREAISEAQCMYNWLTAHGVPAERIWLEEQADNTRENVRYSQALLAERGLDPDAPAALVTSDYHLCRAAYYWGADRAVPVAARMPLGYLPLTVNYYIREAFALAAELVF